VTDEDGDQHLSSSSSDEELYPFLSLPFLLLSRDRRGLASLIGVAVLAGAFESVPPASGGSASACVAGGLRLQVFRSGRMRGAGARARLSSNPAGHFVTQGQLVWACRKTYLP
jgi:hypothetical protein